MLSSLINNYLCNYIRVFITYIYFKFWIFKVRKSGPNMDWIPESFYNFILDVTERNNSINQFY